MRVDLERRGRVLLDLKQEIISLFLPIPARLLFENLIHVMIERLLKMVAESIGILLLLAGQVDQKPADNSLVDLPLILHRPPQYYYTHHN